jgi:ABC-type uncharacterized transport system permease subunit
VKPLSKWKNRWFTALLGTLGIWGYQPVQQSSQLQQDALTHFAQGEKPILVCYTPEGQPLFKASLSNQAFRRLDKKLNRIQQHPTIDPNIQSTLGISTEPTCVMIHKQPLQQPKSLPLHRPIKPGQITQRLARQVSHLPFKS